MDLTWEERWDLQVWLDGATKYLTPDARDRIARDAVVLICVHLCNLWINNNRSHETERIARFWGRSPQMAQIDAD